MAQVFTSYSRRDTQTVDTIVEKLSQAGISVWIDREAIRAGNQWRVQIVQASDTCHAFVLMLSPSSAASDNARKEIDLSQDPERTTQVWDAEVTDEVSGKTIALFPCTQLKVIRFQNDEVLWT
jgi:hypothetical protein